MVVERVWGLWNSGGGDTCSFASQLATGPEFENTAHFEGRWASLFPLRRLFLSASRTPRTRHASSSLVPYVLTTATLVSHTVVPICFKKSCQCVCDAGFYPRTDSRFPISSIDFYEIKFQNTFVLFWERQLFAPLRVPLFCRPAHPLLSFSRISKSWEWGGASCFINESNRYVGNLIYSSFTIKLGSCELCDGVVKGMLNDNPPKSENSFSKYPKSQLRRDCTW